MKAQGFVPGSFDASSSEFLEIVERTDAQVQVANPPFGAIKTDSGDSIRFTVRDPNGTTNFDTTSIDQAIMLNTLFRMPEGSRSVYVIGSGGGNAISEAERASGYRSGKKWNVFATLYDKFTVVDHFTIDGDLYRKQGAGWPIDIIVIDKKPGESMVLPWEKAPDLLTTWDQISERLGNSPAVRSEEGGSGKGDGRVQKPSNQAPRGRPDRSKPTQGDGRKQSPGRDNGSPDRPGGRMDVRPDTELQGRMAQGNEGGVQPKPSGQPQIEISPELDKALDDAFEGLLGAPESISSPVVDANGVPLMVYHGGRPGIDGFQTGMGTGNRGGGEGIFFSTSKSIGAGYASRKRNGAFYSVYLSSPNHLTIEGSGTWSQYVVDPDWAKRNGLKMPWYPGADINGNFYTESLKKDGGIASEMRPFPPLIGIPTLTIAAKQAGFTGVTIRNVSDAARKRDVDVRQDTVVVFSPDQIVRPSDILGAPVNQQSLPADKLPQFIQLAQALVKAGIRTPEDMVRLLDQKFAGKARIYSEALWDAFGMVDKALRGSHEWNAIFENVDLVEPEQTSTAVDQAPEDQPQETIETEAVQDRPIYEPIEDRDPPQPVTEFHSQYKSVSKQPEGSEVITPTNMANAQRQALLRIEREIGDIDEYVTKELRYASKEELYKRLYSYQIDAVAAAIYNIKKGKALINADMTGMGKGRVAAALQSWAVMNGYTPVFVTEKAKLYGDMLRDLDGIDRYGTIRPIITDNGISFEDDRGEKWKTGNQAPTLMEIARTGEFPGDHNAIWTTYTQLGTDSPEGFKENKSQKASRKRNRKAKEEGARMQALRKIAPNAIFILDESHNATGESSDVGMRIRDILKSGKGTYYSSATFAKRPESMPLYFMTDLGDLGLSSDRLIELMTKGGLGMQQFVSNMLAQSGQLIRRERSFEGIEVHKQVATESAERDAELADAYTDIFVEIYRIWKRVDQAVENEKEVLKKLSGNQEATTGVSSVSFTGSTLFNFTNQYLLSLKADSAADEAIRQIKQGNRPVIGLYYTNEAAINDLIEKNLPLTYNGMAHRALDRVLHKTYKHPNGSTETVRIDPDAYGFGDAYRDVVAMIDEAPLHDMPISPIDHMIKRIEDAGYTVGELTGRKTRVVDGKISNRPAKDLTTKGQRRIIKGFNDNDLNAVIINSSAATGISLHASRDFKDFRRRVMIIAQAPNEINTFMQMLGRINRAGQVKELNGKNNLPKFILFTSSLPAENRLATMLQVKLSKLNANTTSNDDSEVSSGMKNLDIFNKYGDVIVRRFLNNNSGFRGGMWALFPENTIEEVDNLWGKKTTAGPGVFSSFISSYLSMSSQHDQNFFWNSVGAEYGALIDYLDRTGQNDLKAQALDYNAKTLEKDTFFEADGSSVFPGPAHLERIEIKAKQKPMTAEEALDAVDYNGSRSAARELYRAVIKSEAAEFEERISRLKGVVDEARRDKTRASNRAKYMQIRETVKTAYAMVGKPMMVMNTDANVQEESEEIQVDTGSMVYGIVTSIQPDLENPSQMARQRLIVTVNSIDRQIQVPMSALRNLNRWTDSQSDWINEYNRTREETIERHTITGNILAAYDRLAGRMTGRPKMVIYTTEGGGTQQGIQMPVAFRGFSETQLSTFSQVAQVINSGRSAFTNFGASIFDYKGRLMFRVPAAKAVGGRIWQLPKYNALMVDGIFHQKDDSMVGYVRRDSLLELFETLKEDGIHLMATPQKADGNDDTLGAPRLPTDFHRFGQRLLKDDRIEKGLFEDITQEYFINSNDESAALARIEFERHGFKESIRRVKDRRNDMQGRVRAMLGMIITRQFDEDYKAAVKDGDVKTAADIKKKATSFADWFLSYQKDSGQTVQAFSAWNRMDAKGYLDAYVEAMDNVAKEAIDGKGWEEAVREITIGVSKANLEAAKEALNNPTLVQALLRASRWRTFSLHAKENMKGALGQPFGRSIWGLYSRSAADKLTKAVIQKFEGAKERPALLEFTKRLTNTLRSEINRLTPEGEKQSKPTDLEVLMEGIRNADKYQQVWGDMQQQVFDQYGSTPEVMEALTEFFGTIMVNPYTRKTVQGVVKAELDFMMLEMKDLVREHWGRQQEVKTSIIERIQERFPELPQSEQETLAKALSEGFEALATAKRDAVLDGIVRRFDEHPIRIVKENWQKILEMSNMGGLTRQDVYRAIASKLNLPSYNPATAARIEEMADRIQLMPDGRAKDQAIQDMMAYIARQTGLQAKDIFISVFYAHILSGYSTQQVNAVSTFMNLMAETAVEAFVNPRSFGRYMMGLFSGMTKGFWNAIEMIATGEQVGTRFNKVDIPPTLEMISFGTKDGVPIRVQKGKGVHGTVAYLAKRGMIGMLKSKPARLLNMHKYVFRFMSAVDMFFFKSAEEARHRVLADKYYRELGLRGEALSRAVVDTLQLTPEHKQAAAKQAVEEGHRPGTRQYRLRVAELIEMGRPDSWNDDAREFGLKTTFNQAPHGILGMFATGIRGWSQKFWPLRLVVPFTNVVSNVTNQLLNYTPYGYVRAKWGHWGEPAPIGEAAQKQFARATLGTIGMVVAVALDLLAEDDDEDDPWFAIYGKGPADYRRKYQLQETGWRPYSIKIGKRYYSYVYTPMSGAFSIAGNWLDAKRYGVLDDKDALTRVAYAVQQVGNTVFSQSFLVGLSDLFTVLNDDSDSAADKGIKFAGRTASSMAIPNLVKQIDRLFDPQVYSASNVVEGFIRDTPVARHSLNPLLNVLGEDVHYNPNRFFADQTTDPVWTLIAEKQAWISAPGKKLGDRNMSPDEYYTYVKLSGPAIKNRLQANLPRLNRMNDEQATEAIREIVNEERKKVRDDLRRKAFYR